ncbi:MAG: ATP-binding cassette domain-containing protein [candidate division Zixibacteria bacterium]|nr:ATP-binding cassette domain-containing protein [candidate division Zixibacteria bacterium]
MITIRGLYKSFDGQPVLKGIDLDIRDNETIVILGPSGQGKTVFIKALVRLLEPDAGTIEYDGVNVVGLTKKAFRDVQKDIAFVFQNSALFDFLTVNDNLSLFLQMHEKITPAEIAEKVSQALAFVGMDNSVLDKFPEELSGGMKKRVAIARAMIKRPKYMFYDEPTTGLDRGSAEKVSELIRMLRGEIAVTSIIVTHDIKLMQDVSDRVALLKDGRIVFVGGKDEISAEMLEFLYETGENNGL